MVDGIDFVAASPIISEAYLDLVGQILAEEMLSETNGIVLVDPGLLDQILVPTSTSESSWIPTTVVTGTRPLPGGAGSGGGGAGGWDTRSEEPGDGGNPSSPYEYFIAHEDASCAKGAALNLGNHFHNVLEVSVGKYEFASIITRNADGTYGALNGGIHTDFEPSIVTLDGLEGTDFSLVVGIVQNQPFDTDVDRWADNYFNKYPSDGDWGALDELVRRGADPSRLSIFITDPWGVTREFKLTDKSMYQAMNDSQRLAGENLPPATTACGG